jgi:hypothetical protein
MKSKARHRLSPTNMFPIRSAISSVLRAPALRALIARARKVGERVVLCALLALGILAWHSSGSMPLSLEQFSTWSGLLACTLGDPGIGPDGPSARKFPPTSLVMRGTVRVCTIASATAIFASSTGLTG